MAITLKTYTYAGDPDYVINFDLGFIDREDVRVQINGAVDGNDDPIYSAFDWVDDSNITVTATLVNGDTVVITRTVSKTELSVDFRTGADITPDNLSRQALQGLMVYQELVDGRVGANSPVVAAAEAEVSRIAAEGAATQTAADVVETNANVATAITQAGIATTQAGLAAASAASIDLGDYMPVAGGVFTGIITYTATQRFDKDGAKFFYQRTLAGLPTSLVQADDAFHSLDQYGTPGGSIVTRFRLRSTGAIDISTNGTTVMATMDWADTTSLPNSTSVVTRTRGDTRYPQISATLVPTGWIASQAEAEAGTQNTRAMTALRTAQAITAQVASSQGYVEIANIDLGADASTIEVAGISAYRNVKYSGYVECSGAGNLLIEARVAAGTWRTLHTIVLGANSATLLSGNLHDFGGTIGKNVKLCNLQAVNTPGVGVDRSDANFEYSTGLSYAAVNTFTEAWAEFRLRLSTGNFKGTTADERSYLYLEGIN